MKKTFISPVAKFVSTEAQQVIAASDFSLKSNYDGNGHGVTDVSSSSLSRQNGSAGQVTTGLNVEALDF